MNPLQFTSFYQRDKTKTLFQPHSAPNFSPQINFTTNTGSNFFPSSTSPSFISHQSQTLKNQGQHGITLQSQKYKSFYTEYQDYRSSSASMINVEGNGQKGYFTENKQRGNLAGTEGRNGFYGREPYKRQTERSQQRKRLYTTNDNYSNGIQDGFTSNSMIFLNKTEYVSPKNSSIVNVNTGSNNTSLTNTFSARPSHISRQKQQQQPLNAHLSKFINPNLSSRTQSNFNSRQKKPATHQQSSNKSQYLQKANKKISLKRDIVSPKFQQQSISSTIKTQSKPPLYKFNGERQTQVSPHHRSISLMLQKEQGEMSTVPVTSEVLLGSSNKPFFSSVVSDNSRGKEMFTGEGMLNPLTFGSRVESVEELRDNSKSDQTAQKKQVEGSKQKGFSKKNKKIATTYQATGLSTKSGSRVSKQVRQIKQPDTLPLSKHQSSSSSTSPRNPPQQPSQSSTLRLSRIQSSTLSLEQKLLHLTLTLQTLTQHSISHQTQLQHITSTLSKQQQQGTSSQDIRRIKKQLKIMKTNFQTAFTSMTEQLNRKLVKEENIMKNFSEEIRKVMEGSVVLQRKIEQVEKGFSGFVKENEERMESLVLNQSFSSNKRSKNNSFQYGLELKNLSSYEDGSGGKGGVGGSLNGENLGRKIQNIQREIKKMKVFHIEQQESYYKQLEDVRAEVETLGMGDKFIKTEQLSRQLSTLSEELSQLKRKGVNDGDKEAQLIGSLRQQISKQVSKMREQLNEQIASVSFELDQTRRNVNSQLYQFRMNKLNAPTIPHPTFAVSPSLPPQLQQRISQLNTKQRQFLITLTQYQQKLIQSEERTHGIYRSVQQLRLSVRDMEEKLGKEIKQGVGRVGERWEGVRQEVEEVKRRGEGVEGKVRVVEERVAEVESRVEREIRVNEIQTENIESVNAEFQRVINREIIPKFAQLHHTNLQTSHAIQLINNQLLNIKPPLNPSPYNTSLNISPLLISPQLQTKIQTLCQSAIQKLLPSPIKILSTKDLPPSSSIPRLLSNQTQHQPPKHQTYLIDQNGYLMDWQGCYLMEVDEKGTRRKVRLTQEEIYFVEVNGVEVIRGFGVV